jgi:hypothetical protein
MTTYLIEILTSLHEPWLRPKLAEMNVVILDERAENGFTKTLIDCDSTTAERIDLAGFHITKAT